MAFLSTYPIPKTIITTTNPTGTVDLYSWRAAIVPVPSEPTGYTVEGLRFVEVNPTQLVVAGATQGSTADQTLYAYGPPITLPAGKDWLAQMISLGESLYLGDRITTDTYPPVALTKATLLITSPIVSPTLNVSALPQVTGTNISTIIGGPDTLVQLGLSPFPSPY